MSEQLGVDRLARELLRLCGGCCRHVRCDETRCPFCGVALDAIVPVGGSNAVALVALLALAGCERARGVDRSPRAARASNAATAEPSNVVLRASTSATSDDVAVMARDGLALAAADVAPTSASIPTDRAPNRSARDAERAAIAALRSADGGLSLAALSSPPVNAAAYGAPPIASSELESDPTLATVRGNASLAHVLAIEPEGADNTVVLRTLRSRATAFRACYERELRNNPSLRGAISIRFSITDGRVTSAPAALDSPAPTVTMCFSSRLRTIFFSSGTPDSTWLARWSLEPIR